MSSISCNESTLHTSNISPTEICLLVAMVLRSASPIVRASNLYCFTARLFSICFRLGKEVRTEEPATQIILANERTWDTLPPSWVQRESRNTTITERGPGDIRSGRYGRVQLP